ncbi:MAG: hypothetical protein LBL38_03775 [Lactobacillales bacterium]|nr:hypothetical protein [Lactobacillales bacterium]
MNEVSGGYKRVPFYEGATNGKIIPTDVGEQIKFSIPEPMKPEPVPGQPNVCTYTHRCEETYTAAHNENGDLQWVMDKSGEFVRELCYDELAKWTVSSV